MILNELTNLFRNKGLKIEPNNSYVHGSLDTKEICELFKKYGCILFRNYDFTAENYKKFTEIFTATYANDTNDTSRRKETKFGKNVREVDAGHRKMSLHSEASFSPSWPEIVWFYCQEAPSYKGETTICDGIKLWDSLSFETKNFFLANPIKYQLKIPVNIKKGNSKKKPWQLNSIGSFDTYLDYTNRELRTKQLRFAMSETYIPGKLSFANHLLHQKPYLDKSIEKWGLSNGKKVPKKYINEIQKKSDDLTYYHKWKNNDLLMIDNRRFMHARNYFKKNDLRVILNTQSLKSNLNISV